MCVEVTRMYLMLYMNLRSAAFVTYTVLLVLRDSLIKDIAWIWLHCHTITPGDGQDCSDESLLSCPP